MRHHVPSPFVGLKVLVVEDETIVSFLLEDMLIELGCSLVWHVGDVKAAIESLNERLPDTAVLDVNLTGELAFPVAERLEAARVPFIFATGYGRSGMPERWHAVPVIQKPFALASLARALGGALRVAL
jgi:CheY-like chemotaxis protein